MTTSETDLIDGTRNETRHVLFASQRHRKGLRKGGRRLHRRKGGFPDVVRGLEAEETAHLRVRLKLLDLQNGWVHVLDIVQV